MTKLCSGDCVDSLTVDRQQRMAGARTESVAELSSEKHGSGKLSDHAHPAHPSLRPPLGLSVLRHWAFDLPSRVGDCLHLLFLVRCRKSCGNIWEYLIVTARVWMPQCVRWKRSLLPLTKPFESTTFFLLPSLRIYSCGSKSNRININSPSFSIQRGGAGSQVEDGGREHARLLHLSRGLLTAQPTASLQTVPKRHMLQLCAALLFCLASDPFLFSVLMLFVSFCSHM